MKCFINS